MPMTPYLERTQLDRKIKNLENRLDFLQVQYYEENNDSISVDKMNELDLIIQYLKGKKTIDDLRKY